MTKPNLFCQLNVRTLQNLDIWPSRVPNRDDEPNEVPKMSGIRRNPATYACQIKRYFVRESRIQAEFTTIFCTGFRATGYQMEFFSYTEYWLHGRQLYEKPVIQTSSG